MTLNSKNMDKEIDKKSVNRNVTESTEAVDVANSETQNQPSKSQSIKPQKSTNSQFSKQPTKTGKNLKTSPNSTNNTKKSINSIITTNQTIGSSPQISNSIKTVTLQNANVISSNNAQQVLMMSGNNQMILLPNQGATTTTTFQNVQVLNSDGNNNNSQSTSQILSVLPTNFSTASGGTQKILLQPYSIVGNATPITTTQASLIGGHTTKNQANSNNNSKIQGSKNIQSNMNSKNGNTIQSGTIQSVQGANIQEILKHLGQQNNGGTVLTTLNPSNFSNSTVSLGGNQYFLLPNNISLNNATSLNAAQQSVSSNNSSQINNNSNSNSSAKLVNSSNKKSTNSNVKPSIIRRNTNSATSGGKKNKVVLTQEQMNKFLEQTNTGINQSYSPIPIIIQNNPVSGSITKSNNATESCERIHQV